MDVVFAAAAAMHSCKVVSRGIPTPHSHTTRVYVRAIRCRLLGPGCVKIRPAECVLYCTVEDGSRRDEWQQQQQAALAALQRGAMQRLNDDAQHCM